MTTPGSIKTLFANDISRLIEEVIKVDQVDDEILRDEINEYVVTDAIRTHYAGIFERYSETPNKPHEGIAIWVSGFFGSGKSSFAEALESARLELADDILFRQYVQWLAGEQWARARAAAGRVALFGDLPFMVNGDSADVWARQDEFRLDASAGVPPDAFSETGGASRLRIAAEEDDLTTLAFGLRAGTVMPIGANTNLRLDGAVGARHLSGDRMIFSLISLDASPTQAFDIRSAAADRFALTGNADATFEFGRAVSLSIGYSGVISGNARDHAARATLGIRF